MKLLSALILMPALLMAQSSAERIDRVAKGLRPRVQVKGEAETRWTVEERQKHYKTPAISVAVMRGGEIEWAHAWGATPETLFQAASISKPVAAAVALRLVADGKLSLDDDVNAKLKSWKVPENSFGKPVTLRRLLSHTAGLTVHGFPGYAAAAEVPTLVQVLEGTKPANTAPVRVDIEPGSKWRYSGGGYEVMQLLVEDVTGKPFAQVAKALVLDAAGMKSSTYQQPLPPALHAKAAVAHGLDGSPIAGRWHTYPEQAAAGLWTTSSDLARFLLAVRANKLLPEKLTNEMLTPVLDKYGLGFGIEGTQFSHGGANAGYRCQAVAFRDTGNGAVVMTNSDAGATLAGEVLRAISAEYGWPTYRTTEREAVRLSAEQVAGLLGVWEVGGRTVDIKAAAGGRLQAATPVGVVEFVPASEGRFFSLSDGVPDMTVERSAHGAVTGLLIGTMRGTRKR